MDLYLNNFSSFGVKIGDTLEIPARQTNAINLNDMDSLYSQNYGFGDTEFSKIMLFEEDLVGATEVEFLKETDG